MINIHSANGYKIIALTFMMCMCQKSHSQVLSKEFEQDSVARIELKAKYPKNPLTNIRVMWTDKVERLISDSLYEKMYSTTMKALKKQKPKAVDFFLSSEANLIIDRYISHKTPVISFAEHAILESTSKTFDKFEKDILANYSRYINYIVDGYYDYEYLFALADYWSFSQNDKLVPEIKKTLSKKCNEYNVPKANANAFIQEANHMYPRGLFCAKQAYSIYYGKLPIDKLKEAVKYNEMSADCGDTFHFIMSNMIQNFYVIMDDVQGTKQSDNPYNKSDFLKEYLKTERCQNYEYGTKMKYEKLSPEYIEAYDRIDSIIRPSLFALIDDNAEKIGAETKLAKKLSKYMKSHIHDAIIACFERLYYDSYYLSYSDLNRITEFIDWQTHDEYGIMVCELENEALRNRRDISHNEVLKDFSSWYNVWMAYSLSQYTADSDTTDYSTYPKDELVNVPEDIVKDANFPNYTKWISQNCKYPNDGKYSIGNGAVQVKFNVTTEGKVEYPRIVYCYAAEDMPREAYRCIKSMPNWTPAYCVGKRFAQTFTAPIGFKSKVSTGFSYIIRE